ncbi:UvrD-helicase domain-containing protein [bacterium]|nr:UvrD-helicase domain-containing protein [bacterium]
MSSNDNIFKSRFLTASAGSGKTYTLTSELYNILETHCKGSDIMCITFTNAGASEMKSRIFEKIQEENINSTYRTLELLYKSGSIRMCTFDSFFFGMLSSWENSLAKIIEEKNKLLLLEDTITELLSLISKNKKSFKELFITATQVNKDIENIIVGLENEGIEFNEICDEQLIIERSKANLYKKEISETFDALKNDIQQIYDSELQIGQFNSWILKPLFNKKYSALITGSLPKCLIKRFNEYTFKGKALKLIEDPSSELNKSWKKTIDFRKLLGKYFIQKEFLKYQAMSSLYTDYQKILNRKKQDGEFLFFKDVGKRLIEQVIDQDFGESLYYLTGYYRIKQLFIDEFQDSSEENLKIILPLMLEILSSYEESNKLLLVGDWKQSIYQWRGADREKSEALLQASEILSNIELSRLEFNWRSSPILISFFNLLVQEIFRGSQESADFQSFPANKKITHSGEVYYYQVEKDKNNNEKLWSFGAQKIIEFINTNCDMDSESSISDCCVLVRSRTDKDKIIRHLEQLEIETSELKGVQFLSSEDGIILYNAVSYVMDIKNSAFYKLILPEKLFEKISSEYQEFLEKWETPYKYSFLCSFINTFELRSHVRDLFISRFLYEAMDFFQNSTESLEKFLSFFFKTREHISLPVPEQKNRIKISTIHGSKGLQFKHVFVFLPAVSEKCNYFLHPNRNAYLKFPKDIITLLESYEPENDDEAKIIIDLYQNALQKGHIEEKNNLYVAATRAEQTLIFIADGKSPGAIDVQNAFTRKSNETDRHKSEITQHEFDDHIIIKMNAVNPVKSVKKIPLESKSDILELSQFSPSLHEVAEGDFTDRILEKEITSRGTILHSILEKIGTKTLEETFIMLKRKVSDQNTYKLLYDFISDPEIQEIIFRNGKVLNEHSVSDKTNFGIIDRLIIEQNRITIIDYKSHSGNKQINPELLQQYREQLQRYMRIIGNIFPGKKVESYLLFIDDREIIQVN